MPTYTYRCTKCGEDLEVVQSMTDPPLKRCRSCRGKLQRTFHPVGIVLKGSGFYKTDYRASQKGQDRDGSSGEKGTKGGEKDTKSESSKSDGKADGGSSGSKDTSTEGSSKAPRSSSTGSSGSSSGSSSSGD